MGHVNGSRYPLKVRKQAEQLIRVGAGKKLLSTLLAIPRYTGSVGIRLSKANGGGNMTRRREYDWQTKVAAARDHVDGGVSLATVMAKYGIRNDRTLKDWCRLYRTRGEAALLPHHRGRLKGAKNHPKIPSTAQKLAQENEYLKAKVAWLEKLQALWGTSHAGRKA